MKFDLEQIKKKLYLSNSKKANLLTADICSIQLETKFKRERERERERVQACSTFL